MYHMIILSAWSTNLVITYYLSMTKGIISILIICQVCLFVMGGQHVLITKFVLQALGMNMHIFCIMNLK